MSCGLITGAPLEMNGLKNGRTKKKTPLVDSVLKQNTHILLCIYTLNIIIYIYMLYPIYSRVFKDVDVFFELRDVGR